MPARRETPLIPRADFFAPANFLRHAASPDRRWISWQERVGDGFRVWIAPVADPTAARRIPLEPVLLAGWTYGNAQLVVNTRRRADELYQTLCLIRPDDLRVTVLNPPGWQLQVHRWIAMPSRPDHLVAAFARGGEWSIQRFHVRSGRSTELWSGEVSEDLYWHVDDRLDVCLIGQLHNPGKHHRTDWIGRTSLRAKWRPLPGGGPHGYSSLRAVLPDGRFLMFERAQTVLVDLAVHTATGVSGRQADRLASQQWKRWWPPDDVAARNARAVAAIAHRVKSMEWWGSEPGVLFRQGNATADVWVYDDRTGGATMLHPTRKVLPLAKRVGVRIPTPRGEVRGFLTTPRGTARHTPVPAVMVLPSGGSARDFRSGRHDPLAQWLANRGYAVLQINKRQPLSRKFRTNGPAHLSDLLSAARWLIAEGHTRRGKVALYAHSLFESFCATWLLTEAPTLFAAAVMGAPPVDLVAHVQELDRRFGDNRNCYGDYFTDGGATDDRFLRRLSPTTRLDRRRAALLLVERHPDGPITTVGAANPEMLRKHGIGEVIEARDADPDAQIEAFLARHLGGRVEGSA